MLPSDLMDSGGDCQPSTTENTSETGSHMLAPTMVQDLEGSAPWRRDYRRPTLTAIVESTGSDISHEPGSPKPLSIPQITLTLPDSDTIIPAVTDYNANVKPLRSPDEEDFDMLKATTTRLKLSTRRPSVTAWKKEHLEKRNIPKPSFEENVNNDGQRFDDGFTEERKERINQALAWLKNELMEMRSQDQLLARQLLSIRHEIHQLKLKRSCEQHKTMLDDVTQDVAEVHELHEITDIPLSDSYGETPLKQLGITRMHLSGRRFSTC